MTSTFAERRMTDKVTPLLEPKEACERACCGHLAADHVVGGCIYCRCRAFVELVCDHPLVVVARSRSGRRRYELCRLCGATEEVAV